MSQEFKIENNSDLYTDYNEKDAIRVRPDHPLYAQVSAAHEKAVKRNAEQYAEQVERYKYAHTARPAAWVAAWKAL